MFLDPRGITDLKVLDYCLIKGHLLQENILLQKGQVLSCKSSFIFRRDSSLRDTNSLLYSDFPLKWEAKVLI